MKFFPASLPFVVPTSLLLAITGCAGPCDREGYSPLGPCAYFDVLDWCVKTNRCTVDGFAAGCNPTACPLQFLAAGQTLQIPLVDATERPAGARDAVLIYAGGLGVILDGGGPPVYPDVVRAKLTIDGAAAQYDPSTRSRRGAVFRWDPFPPSPQIFEFTFSDGNVPIELGLQFEDASCEAALPICGL